MNVLNQNWNRSHQKRKGVLLHLNVIDDSHLEKGSITGATLLRRDTDSEKAFHIWGKIVDSQNLFDFWVPKNQLIVNTERKVEVDYSLYSQTLHSQEIGYT